MSPPDNKQRQPHQPVLYHEVLYALQPRSMGRYVDATVGAGGHAWGILEASGPDGCLLGFDLDPAALQIAQQRLSSFDKRVVLVQASYTCLSKQLKRLGWDAVEGIVADLGVSSMQFDTPERGFSIYTEGPLDMRFDPHQRQPVAELVNTLPEQQLADLIWRYGEEKMSRKIAHAIVQARPLATTKQLAEVIAKTAGGKRGHTHPATRTFQALRIAVNNEMEMLEEFLPQAVKALAPGARLAVISFHSLEDRIVKQFFRQESRNCICPPRQPLCTCQHKASILLLTNQAITPTATEIQVNPRARSARLRIAEKLEMA